MQAADIRLLPTRRPRGLSRAVVEAPATPAVVIHQVGTVERRPTELPETEPPQEQAAEPSREELGPQPQTPELEALVTTEVRDPTAVEWGLTA